MSDINIFATTDFRGEEKPFGIKRADRRLHVYVIGRTGMGKTTLLQNMILNDVYGGEGLCFLDPHGDAVEQVLGYIPDSRRDDVISFNPADTDHPLSLNVLDKVEPEKRHLLISGLLSVFRRLFGEHWQHRQEHILRNALFTLLEQDGAATLIEVYQLLTDWRYRKAVVARVQDPIVKSFWQHEFSAYLYQFKGEALAPILNKLGAFLTAPLMRNILGQPQSSIDFSHVIDQGKILLVNLAKGRIGEDSAMFLGSLIVTKLHLAAMSRIDVKEEQRKDFYLYVDEFQNFIAGETFDSMLSEARKYRLCLTLAHQYLGQLSDAVRQAIFGNAGTLIAFPVGAQDAEVLQGVFGQPLRAQDFIEPRLHHIYVKLAIDGKTSRAFSAVTEPFSRFRK